MATSQAMKEWEQKYKTQIEGLAKYNNVDMGVAASMLQANLTGGGQYKGGGTINSVQAATELKTAQEKARATTAKPTTSTSSTSSAYDTYLQSLQQQAEQQRRAEEEAQRLRTQQAVANVQSYIPMVQSQTDKQLQEAYIAAQRAKTQAPQALSALGYTGGATESSLMGLESDYMAIRGGLEKARAQSLDNLYRNIADIESSGNVALSELAGQYYNQMMQNQREAMAQAQAQERWEREFAASEAERAFQQQKYQDQLAAYRATPQYTTQQTAQPAGLRLTSTPTSTVAPTDADRRRLESLYSSYMAMPSASTLASLQAAARRLGLYFDESTHTLVPMGG